MQIITRLPTLLAENVTGSLDAAQADEVSTLAGKLPGLVRLIPPLLEIGSLQGDVVCSEMLSRLLKLGGSLRVLKWVRVPSSPFSSRSILTRRLLLCAPARRSSAHPPRKPPARVGRTCARADCRSRLLCPLAGSLCLRSALRWKILVSSTRRGKRIKTRHVNPNAD